MTGGPFVAVIGDVMLDTFEDGRVARLSPEAPVPVLLNPVAREVLGGAANTALGTRALGARTRLVGAIGDDVEGRRLTELCMDQDVDPCLHVADVWPTVTKRRFMSGSHQILRLDREEPLPEVAALAIVETVAGNLEGAAALVISDYDKGVVTDEVARAAMGAARDMGIPMIIDSKRLDPTPFQGCTVIAPNLMEATRMTGSSDPRIAAERIAERTRSAVAVTLGPDGILLWAEGRADHVASRAQEVADVTGAGDSVTAGLAVGLLEGMPLLEATHFASDVAAVAVARKGTHAVQRSEVVRTEW